ncbi:LOW QUALITY PROTEIN: hypothetical protein RTBOTA2_000088 [Rhodotorula toruloides]|nr:LOW QUALITY PROTEIN: hypothetical protein RTBOTA2_000088 [Rhodotorula toruloides]
MMGARWSGLGPLRPGHHVAASMMARRVSVGGEGTDGIVGDEGGCRAWIRVTEIAVAAAHFQQRRASDVQEDKVHGGPRASAIPAPSKRSRPIPVFLLMLLVPHILQLAEDLAPLRLELPTPQLREAKGDEAEALKRAGGLGGAEGGSEFGKARTGAFNVEDAVDGKMGMTEHESTRQTRTCSREGNWSRRIVGPTQRTAKSTCKTRKTSERMKHVLECEWQSVGSRSGRRGVSSKEVRDMLNRVVVQYRLDKQHVELLERRLYTSSQNAQKPGNASPSSALLLASNAYRSLKNASSSSFKSSSTIAGLKATYRTCWCSVRFERGSTSEGTCGARRVR